MSKSFNTKLDGILKTHRLDVEIAANTEIDPFFEANITLKAAIKQLIKELVAEAKPGIAKNSLGWNEAADQFEQNLLKELEEV